MRLLDKFINFFVYLIIYVLGIYLTILSLNFFSNMYTEKFISDIGQIITNLCGGILGGIIAFGVAKAQIKNEQKKAEDEELKELNNIITLLNREIEHNKNIYKSIQERPKDHLKLISSFNHDVWDTKKFYLVRFLENNVFNAASSYYDEIKEIKSGTNPDYDIIISEKLEDRINQAEKLKCRINSLL